MAEQRQTQPHRTGNSRETPCPLTNQRSTLDFSTNSEPSVKCGNAINVLHVRQGIQRHRAPIEESQDKESCVRRPMSSQQTDKFSEDGACADAPAHRPMRSLAQCCN